MLRSGGGKNRPGKKHPGKKAPMEKSDRKQISPIYIMQAHTTMSTSINDHSLILRIQRCSIKNKNFHLQPPF